MPARVIGIVAHPGKPGAAELVGNLVTAFAAHGLETLLDEEAAALVGRAGVSQLELAERCELLVAGGGDGTLLKLVRAIQGRQVPIFGINLGSLGFLTGVSSSAWEEAVASIVAQNFVISWRTLLEVKVEGNGVVLESRLGLNDAVISRGALSRLIKLRIRVNNRELTEYNADGLIIATPTGSTAYSLSSGGPIIDPDAEVFVITPICPHVLTNRSVIISDESAMLIEPCPGEAETFLTVDGQDLIRVVPGQFIRIARAEIKAPLATLPGLTFFDVLRQKLKWSGTAL